MSRLQSLVDNLSYLNNEYNGKLTNFPSYYKYSLRQLEMEYIILKTDAEFSMEFSTKVQRDRRASILISKK